MGPAALQRVSGLPSHSSASLLGFVVVAVVRVCLFVCLFGVLYSLVELLLSHTSPQGSHEGSGCPGLTSGSCVSPPGPDEATPLSPPGTGLRCPHLQTPGTAAENEETLWSAAVRLHLHPSSICLSNPD